MNKLIISVLLMVGLVGMIGTAAANPEMMFLAVDGTTDTIGGSATGIAQPLILDNTGGTTDFDIQMYAYGSALGAGTSHTMTVSINSGTGSDLTVTLTERSGGASVSGTLNNPIALTWIQDNAGDGSNNVVDYIDISISSTGTDGADYQILIDDSGGAGAEVSSQTPNLKNIPEFPTVALPIAAILGLMFIISSRKKKE